MWVIGFQGGAVVKNPPARWRPGLNPWVRKINEWKMKSHSSTLAWKIPWTEEPWGQNDSNMTEHACWLYMWIISGK